MEETKRSGRRTPEMTELEFQAKAVIRRAGAEGMVLLENDGTLPLAPGTNVALYGYGARYTIKGGTGSGAVNNRADVSVCEGLKNAGLVITNEAWLDDYDRRYAAAYEEWKAKIYALAGEQGNYMALYRAHAANPIQAPAGLPVECAEADTETAVFVLSRVSGEGADRRLIPGDYYISDEEKKCLQELCAFYRRVVLVLNVGGVIDLGFTDDLPISAIVLMSQAGEEGGNALGDILTGKVNPSAKLTMTWAREYMDYPEAAHFSSVDGNVIQAFYKEGIYVGYRYFDAFGKKPRYPFGYGLSYTSFAWEQRSCRVSDGDAEAVFAVTNTGSVPGREVLQAYLAASFDPSREEKKLTAFARTPVIEPGETKEVLLSFPLSELARYDAGRECWRAPKGTYAVLVGNSSVDPKCSFLLDLGEEVVVRQVRSICPLCDALAELKPEKKESPAWPEVPVLAVSGADFREPAAKEPSEEALAIRRRAEEIAAQISLEEAATIVCGRFKGGPGEIIGAASSTVPGAAGEISPILKKKYGVQNLILADGPAGIRVRNHYQIDPATGQIRDLSRYENLENRLFRKEFPIQNGIDYYQFTSAIPVGTLLAQSFAPENLEELGKLIAAQMQDLGISVWLAPGLNIQKNPLCGRNFEYYSEDPLVSGKMAAAITRGVQSAEGCCVTIKHFACNNQEENRFGVDSIVSERALREIYLKGFEIAVREAHPKAIMTSYNKVNAVHSANSYDLCTETARNEWGFDGVIMTDWTTTNHGGGSSAAKCMAAGNDLVMPGSRSDVDEIVGAVRRTNGQHLEEEKLRGCAARVIGLCLALAR